MQPFTSTKDQELQHERDLWEKQELDIKFMDFVSVMSAWKNRKNKESLSLENGTNLNTTFRPNNKKRQLTMEEVVHAKRQRGGADTSTPAGPRQVPCVIASDDDSPLAPDRTTESEIGQSIDPCQASPTNLTLSLEKNKLSLNRRETRSLEIQRVLTTTFNLERAAKSNGLLKRGGSLPCLNLSTENVLFSEYVSRVRSMSMSDIDKLDLSSCSWPEEENIESVVDGIISKDSVSEAEISKDSVSRAKISKDKTMGSTANKYLNLDVDNELEVVSHDEGALGGEQCGSGQTKYNSPECRTPKRKLFTSPGTTEGLEAKIEKLVLNQFEKPTLRTPVFGHIVSQKKDLNEVAPSLESKNQVSSLRRKIVGRRRFSTSSQLLENDETNQTPGFGPVGNGGHPTTPVQDRPGPGGAARGKVVESTANRKGKNSKNSKPRRYKKNKSVVVDCNQPRIDVVLKRKDSEKVTGEDGVSLIQINSAFTGKSHSEQMMDGGENL